MHRIITLALLSMPACVAALAHAGDGLPDPDFGNHAPGISLVDVVVNAEISIDEADVLLVLPDGGLLVGGHTQFAHARPPVLSLVRLDAGGQRDPGFGSNGAALIDPGAGVRSPRPVALLARDDGGWLLLASASFDDAGALLLCRVAATGTPEVACMRLPAPPGLTFRFGPMAAASDGQGRILSLASVGPPAFSLNTDLAVARWHADGSPDADFGDDGAVLLTRFDELAGQVTRETAAGIAVDGGGRIVIAATSLPRGVDGDGTPVFAAARLLASGQIDTAFGEGGARRLPVSLPVEARALAVAADGSSYLGGHALVGTAPASHFECALARLDAQGDVDAGYGDGGILRIAFETGAASDAHCTALAAQPDGRLVAAGVSRNHDVPEAGNDLAAVRLWPDGRIDRGFGNRGNGRYIGAVDLGGVSGNMDRLDALAWHDDHLHAAGSARSGYNQDEFVAVRLRADGLLDDGFD